MNRDYMISKEKADLDLDHLKMILINGHLYCDAPENTEQKIAFELGIDICNKLIEIIEKIPLENNETDPLKVFEYLLLFMTNANNFSKFYLGTPENYAYNMSNENREKVIKMINLIRQFDPYA